MTTSAAHKAHETRRQRAADRLAEAIDAGGPIGWTAADVAEARRAARAHAAELLDNVERELSCSERVTLDRKDEDTRLELRGGERAAMLRRIPRTWLDMVAGHESKVNPATGFQYHAAHHQRADTRDQWCHVDEYVSPHGLAGMEGVHWLFARLAYRDEVRSEIAEPVGRFLCEPTTAWLLDATAGLSGAELAEVLADLGDSPVDEWVA